MFHGELGVARERLAQTGRYRAGIETRVGQVRVGRAGNRFALAVVDKLELAAHELEILDELLLEDPLMFQRLVLVAQIIGHKMCHERHAADLIRIILHHESVALDQAPLRTG